jgi:hypothetical protein
MMKSAPSAPASQGSPSIDWGLAPRGDAKVMLTEEEGRRDEAIRLSVSVTEHPLSRARAMAVVPPAYGRSAHGASGLGKHQRLRLHMEELSHARPVAILAAQGTCVDHLLCCQGCTSTAEASKDARGDGQDLLLYGRPSGRYVEACASWPNCSTREGRHTIPAGYAAVGATRSEVTAQ